MKIIGNTVGMGLPKPNLMQTDPRKGDYVKGKEEFLKQVNAGATAEEAAQIQQNKTDIETLTREKLSADALPDVVNEALAQAKASGEFKGEPGEPGKTPEKGKDYFTDADKQEIAEQAAQLVENPVSGAGLTDTEKTLILSLFRNAAYTSADMGNTLNQLEALWNGGEVEPDEPDEPVIPDEPEEPEKTLTSISATYSGGDVTAGTDVSALTDIVVTAHYSDGSTEPVTDYTLAGEIAEGSNTVTVSYQGKTATFTVTGVAEEAPEEPETWKNLFDGITFTKSNSAEFNFGYLANEPITLPAGTYYLYDTYKSAAGAEFRLYTEADGTFTNVTGERTDITDNNSLYTYGEFDQYGTEQAKVYQPYDDAYLVEYTFSLAEEFTGYLWLHNGSRIGSYPECTLLFTKHYNPFKDTLVFE